MKTSLRKFKRFLRNALRSDRAKLREQMQNEVEERFKPLFIAERHPTPEIFDGVVASQAQQPPFLSFLIEAPEKYFSSEASLPCILLSSLIRQQSERWELLVYCENLPSYPQHPLRLWVELLRAHTDSPIRLVESLNGLNAWGSLVAWSSGSYLMAVTPNTWLDQDLVASLALRFKGLETAPNVITLDAISHSHSKALSSGSVEQILLGLEHDRWSLQSGWGGFPFLLKRRWVLQLHGLHVPVLADPESWQQALLENDVLPQHCQGLFASATQRPFMVTSSPPRRRQPLPSYTAVVTTGSELQPAAERVEPLLDQMMCWSHPPSEVILVATDPNTKNGRYRHKFILSRVVRASQSCNSSLSVVAQAIPGIAAATCDLIMIINQDVLANDLFAAESLFEPYAESYTGISSPRVIDSESRLLHRGVMGGMMSGIGYPGYLKKADVGCLEFMRTAERRLVSMVNSDVMVIPRVVWDRLGGIDHSLPDQYGVLDFCLRAGMLGYQSLYNGKSVFSSKSDLDYAMPCEAGDDAYPNKFYSMWEVMLENDSFRHSLRSREAIQEEPSLLCREWIAESWRSGHWLIIPVYDDPSEACLQRWLEWRLQGFNIILVDNKPSKRLDLPARFIGLFLIVPNHNRHRLAGGINRGMATTEAKNADVITILDQDSCIDVDSLDHLRCHVLRNDRTIWGPMIYDLDRCHLHAAPGLRADWFLMTSGTTLRHRDWLSIGPYNEKMEIDYLDHEWSARAVGCGYQLKCSQDALLLQTFGSQHPNSICRRVGMHLYSPLRHEASVRNLLWMINNPLVPASFKLKESVKMLFKPLFWLLFEPQRRKNLNAVVAGMSRGLTKESSSGIPPIKIK